MCRSRAGRGACGGFVGCFLLPLGWFAGRSGVGGLKNFRIFGFADTRRYVAVLFGVLGGLLLLLIKDQENALDWDCRFAWTE